MKIFKLHPEATPKVLIVLPEKICHKAKAQWLLTRVIQPAGLNIKDVAFAGVMEPAKGKLKKADILAELDEMKIYIDTYGINIVAIGHADIFKYVSGGVKFMLNFGRSVEGVDVKGMAKVEGVDYTGINLVPFMNPIILNIYPNKVTEVQRGLSVINKLLHNDYSDPIENLNLKVNKIITDPQEAVDTLKYLFKYDVLTADIETTGLSWNSSRLLTFSMSPNEEEAYCFVIDAQYHSQAVENTMKDYLKRFFIAWKGKIIGHNWIGFDQAFIVHQIMRTGDYSVRHEELINMFNLEDTIIKAYLLYNSTERVSIGLKELSFKYLGEYDADVDVKRLEVAPLEKVATYNNYDCIATWKIYNELQPMIVEQGFEEVDKEFQEIACTLLKVKMNGLRVDIEATKEFLTRLVHMTQEDREALLANSYIREAEEASARDALVKYNKTHVGKKRDWVPFREDFNPQSPKQKQTLFFDLMDLPVVNKSKTTKAPSSDAETVDTWLNNDSLPEDKLEVVKLVSEYMTAGKVMNTYVKVILEKAVEVAPGDWRIFTNFNQTATITGRLSSSGDINLQTIPNSSKYGKEVKKLFIAPEGSIMATADYAALEDRLIANESQDENKLNIFLKGIDGHCLNAYGYFKDEFADRGIEYDITNPDSINKMKREAPDLRQDGKAYTFGYTYGAGPKKYGPELFNAYWETYAGVKTYNNGVIKKARKDGFYVSKFSGMRLWVPAINALDDFTREKEERVVCNFSIQSGNFLMLRALHKTQLWIEEHGYTEEMQQVNTVHDSEYSYIKEDPYFISELNKGLVGFMGVPYDDNQTLELTANLDIGYNMLSLEEISNNADSEEILKTLEETM